MNNAWCSCCPQTLKLRVRSSSDMCCGSGTYRCEIQKSEIAKALTVFFFRKWEQVKAFRSCTQQQIQNEKKKKNQPNKQKPEQPTGWNLRYQDGNCLSKDLRPIPHYIIIRKTISLMTRRRWPSLCIHVPSYFPLRICLVDAILE